MLNKGELNMSLIDQPWYIEPKTINIEYRKEVQIVGYIINGALDLAEHMLFSSNLSNEVSDRLLDMLISHQ